MRQSVRRPCLRQPRTLPGRGMALVEEETAKALAQARRKAAILIFDGVEIIDYTGPYEDADPTTAVLR